MSFNDAAQRSGKAGAGPNGSFGGSSGSDKNFPDQLQQYQVRFDHFLVRL